MLINSLGPCSSRYLKLYFFYLFLTCCSGAAVYVSDQGEVQMNNCYLLGIIGVCATQKAQVSMKYALMKIS